MARARIVIVGGGFAGYHCARELAKLARGGAAEIVLLNPTDYFLYLPLLPQVAGGLLDTADHVLPGLDPRLSRTADRVLRSRGMDVRMGVSVKEAMAEGVQLSTSDFVPTRTLVWCVGVRPDPFLDSLGLKTAKGRVVVDEYFAVPDRPEVLACGDAAAVPDLTRPGEVTAMTAQHAERQGRLAARNIAASYGVGRRRPYRHHDLGFTVDLGGGAAAANPLHVPLSGPTAAAVTAGYHLLALPANRVRVAADWLLGAVMPRQAVQLGVVEPSAVPLETGPGS